MPGRALPFRVGVDLGSTTIKIVAVESGSDACIWRHYERHETQVAEKLLAALLRLERDTGIAAGNCSICATGSAAAGVAPAIGARLVQDVHAISLAVEKLHPGVETVIELGGQDAKIIVFRGGQEGARKKLPSMNDKCAGGTGAVIDKIAVKLGISPADLERQPYAGVRLHPVAGKCGVFAETDITGLLKRGVPAGELIASLFDALVLQNLSVLTRGYTLYPQVLLLGGPNTFLRGLREAWQHRIPETWRERGVGVPAGQNGDAAIFCPPFGHCYGALGALEFGRLEEEEEQGHYRGHEALDALIHERRREGRRRPALPALVQSEIEREDFVRAFAPPPFVPPRIDPGERVPAYLGLDAGSTSTKGVLLSPTGEVLAKAYRLSLGNPIEDAMGIIGALRGQIEDACGHANILGAATTGYAKDILRDVLRADVAIAETVAHTESAKQLYRDPHVIVDVGGQDIKLIVLKDGRVKDFRLNTQCSAGNGYFLHATAESFGIPVEQYADAAFAARVMPLFGYGCAVFLQSDIATFQRHGWTREEILAGLAAVLPKNVFLYVARVANLARLGTRFILQGGTQRNLAVVKAEVDFIRESFGRSGVEPEIIVHRHAGECGAIGAALEAMRVVADGRASTFIGMEAAEHIEYRTTCGPETRCAFCRNRCARTFIDVVAGGTGRRVVAASCERGTQLDLAAVRAADAAARATQGDAPDFVAIAAREVWGPQHPAPVPAGATPAWPRLRVPPPRRPRSELRVGIPRVLNLYSYAPLFSAYLESLGVPPKHIVYSDVTSTELYRSGSSRGSIDPCFPSKVALAHVHNLIAVKHRRAPLDCIFFPMFDVLDSPLVATRGQYACPTVAVTPRTVKAAFTKEGDAFAASGVLYLDPLLNLANRPLLALQMFEAWGPVLGLKRRENAAALEAGFAALDAFWARMRARARAALDCLERDDRIGIVVLGRPYHHDPGINHGILAELQKRGYTIFSQVALPRDPDLLERLFGDEVRRGAISHPLDISDVWKHTTSENTNQKIWAAKFVARHPNLVALEFSSFKCGHDAPVYSVIESIVEAAGRPYLGFKDLDENRAVGAVKLRLETMEYFLKRYAQDVKARQERRRAIDERLAEFERRLRQRMLRSRERRQARAGASAS